MSFFKKNDITIAEIFYTIIGWTFFILVNSMLIILMPLLIIITFPFDKDKKVIIYVIKFFCRIFYTLNFVQKTTFYKNNLTPPKIGERRIYVLNHASMFDTILMYLLPGPIKSVMKEAYAKIPVIGWIATLGGNIVISDDKNNNKIGVYMNIVDKLERGNPVIIFPEGTKSKNSKIGKFYHGTFKIALETKAELVPVVFDTWNVIRPGGLWIRDVHHTIKILDPVPYDSIKDLNYKEISNLMRIKLLKGLTEIRDERRNKSKNYYRHREDFLTHDIEMKEELKVLENQYVNKKIINE